MTPRWGMMISRGAPQALITNHRNTNQGVKTMGEGKDARVAGDAVRFAAIRYRNAAKAARKRGEIPLRNEVARVRAGILLNAAAAWHPIWLKWRGLPGGDAPAGCTHPAGESRLGEVFQASKRFGFAVSPGKPVPHPGRRDPEGGGAAPEEGLHVHAMAEDPGNRGGNRPGGVIRMPPKPAIPGPRSSS